MSSARLMTLITQTFISIRDLIKRVALTRPADEKGNYQVVQCQYMGHVADVEAISVYGYSYNAPINSTGLMWNVQGNSDNRAAIFYMPQKRFKLKPGEVEIGSPETQSSIKFDIEKNVILTSFGKIEIIGQDTLSITTTGDVSVNTNGNVNIESAQTATIKSPQIILDGNVIITQNLNVSGTANGITLQTHQHSGVTSGGDDTGPPV